MFPDKLQILIWRHREFTLQYNASCDSFNPKHVSEIIKDLEKSEKVKMSETKKTPVRKTYDTMPS